MRPVVVLALRLAWSPDPRQRWRQISVLVAAGLAAFLGVVGLAVIGAAAQADRVREMRQPVAAPPGSTPAMYVMTDAIVVDGFQGPLLWIELGPGGTGRGARIVPPGLTSFPPPGSVVVSPALAARNVDAERLGMTRATTGSGPGGAIGADGLATASERFAYAVPEVGKPLTQSAFAQPSLGYGAGPPEERASIEATEPMISERMAALLVGWLVGLSAILALLAVAHSYSEVRERRVKFLHRQGVFGVTLRFLSGVESLALSLPGALIGAAVGWAVCGRLGVIPATRIRLWEGSAELSWWTALCVALGVAAVVILAAVIGPVRRRSQRTSRRARPAYVGVLATGLVLMLGSALLPQGGSGRMVPLLLGLALTTVGIPLAVPIFTAWLGRRLGRAESAEVWLIGRRMEARAGVLARPASAGAALVFMAGAAFAIYAGGNHLGEIETSGPQVYVARWAGTDEQAVGAASALRPDWTVAEVGERGVRVDECSRVGPACGQGRLASSIQEFLRQRQINLVNGPVGDVQGALIVTPGNVEDADLIRALGAPTGVTVDRSTDHGSSAGALHDWAGVGGVIAATVFVLLVLREAGERTLMAAVHDRPLQRLSIGATSLARVRWASMVLPMVVSFPLGVFSAIAFSYFGLAVGLTAFEAVRVTMVGAVCSLGAIGVISAAIALGRAVDAKVAMHR